MHKSTLVMLAPNVRNVMYLNTLKNAVLTCSGYSK